MLKELPMVDKNTPSNQNIRFNANAIRISPIYYLSTWQLWHTFCLPLEQDCAVIIMFDKKGDVWIKKADF